MGSCCVRGESADIEQPDHLRCLFEVHGVTADHPLRYGGPDRPAEPFGGRDGFLRTAFPAADPQFGAVDDDIAAQRFQQCRFVVGGDDSYAVRPARTRVTIRPGGGGTSRR